MNQGLYSRIQTADDPLPQRLVSFMDESYFSLFYSPRQLKQPAVAKYACNILFVLLLGVKFKLQGIPWITVFLPSFLSNIISIIMVKNELKYIWATIGANYSGLCRPIAQILDTIGSFYLKIVVLSVLSSYKNVLENSSFQWTAVLIPAWMMLGTSAILRFVPYFPANATAAYRKKHILCMLSGTMAYILLRFLQPLFISLRLDGYFQHHLWSTIFAPSWVLTFFGLACALLMISLSPFINNFANADYRIITRQLLYLLAFQIAVISVASIVFIVFVTQALDFQDSKGDKGAYHDMMHITVPLMVLFAVLVLTYPLLVQYSLKFQQFISARNLALQMNRPSFGLLNSNVANASSDTYTPFQKIEKITWLIQTNNSGTTYSVADARSINQLLGSRDQDCIAQDARQDVRSEEQRVHDHLDTAFTSSLPISLTRKPQEKEKEKDKAILGDIELGEISRDVLDTELPSPTPVTQVTSSFSQTSLNPLALPTNNTEGFLPATADMHTVAPCVICMARPMNTILMPCGHAIVCLTCVLQLGKKASTAHCPVCRVAISSWFHLQQAPLEVASSSQNRAMITTGESAAATAANSTESPTHIVRLAVASREYQLQFPTTSNIINNNSSNSTASFTGNDSLGPSAASASLQQGAATILYDYQQHTPAHDALFDILFP